LLDDGKLQEQLLTLVMRGGRIDHQATDHDDSANAACGALVLAGGDVEPGWLHFMREEAERVLRGEERSVGALGAGVIRDVSTGRVW
jgi:hypothetical protein